MIKREDGRETRKRLLDAASEVFAQKGFRDAKVTDICKRANANVASVNYYFGNKVRLYVETWLYTFQRFEGRAFLELEDAPPHDLLREYVLILMKSFTKDEGMRQFSRLYMMELGNPTGLIEEEWRESVEPQRRRLHNILRKIIGQDAENQSILFCELSIVAQCRILLSVKQNDLEYLLGQTLDEKLIRRLADHIITFSLAGIKAVGNSCS